MEDDQDKQPLLVFFDIEAMQDTRRPVRFKGEHCIRDFLEWLDTLTEDDTRPVTVIAHNFQGYDGYFIVDEYHKQHRIKLLQVTFHCIRFIDSLSFFQMPLSTFPRTFGLTELKKGHFPHQFNTPANTRVCGTHPS